MNPNAHINNIDNIQNLSVETVNKNISEIIKYCKEKDIFRGDVNSALVFTHPSLRGLLASENARFLNVNALFYSIRESKDWEIISKQPLPISLGSNNITVFNVLKSNLMEPRTGLFILRQKTKNRQVVMWLEEQLIVHSGDMGTLIFIYDSEEAIKDLLNLYIEKSKEYIKSTIENRVIYYDGAEFDFTLYKQSEPDWDSLILNNNRKEDLLEDVKWFFSEDARNWYQGMGFSYKRGLLFSGPPGNGKTTWVKNIINTLKNIRFLIYKRVSDHDFNINSFFEVGNRLTPVVLIFEDLDLMLDIPDVRREFLNCLDGTTYNPNGMLVIGTTNKPEHIDEALTSRPSRFDKVVNFGNPDEESRHKYLKSFLDFEDERLKKIVKLTDDLSFAFLKELYTSIVIKEKTNNKKLTDKEIEGIISQLKIHKKNIADEPAPSVGFGNKLRLKRIGL